VSVELHERLLLDDAPRGGRVAYGAEASALLKRMTQHTLSSDVVGLTSPQNLAEILYAQRTLRPIVSSSRQVNLATGKLTFPKLAGRPTAIEQTVEKTEGGGTKLDVDQAEIPAKTFLSSGNLSWQAAKWSTPDSLQLWLTLAAQAYARSTEVAAAQALVAGVTATAAVPSDDLAGWLDAITSSAASVQAATDFPVDVIYCDPVIAARLLALVLAEAPGGSGTVGPMRIVSSNGLAPASPVAIVGNSQALLCAESPDAPVQLQAVEPAIGGIEVGVIGSFAAAVADADAFVSLTAP
jgi:hypothetical protein